ncbi:outer membrane protein assembly factor BamD [Plastoroseomonas arctica]|uniref:Outer membrane protein assembly factor BamD n=1 Tax=Plastoroseomonas arctica TaxID=1509237 RepID=A0AAF1KLN4_9PROT|nr:outer membrane protein assembly factor BamD [Plastoroseomonas arctica]MBR0654956.1 outer membrane protein assembly factor BamD [Plastoroseomonas arctica]
MRFKLVTLLPILAVTAGLAACGDSNPRPWDGTNAGRISNSTTRSSSSGTTAASEAAPEDLYAEGMRQLRAQNFATAARAFDAVEREHPYSTWATSAKLMAAYTEYQRNRYTEAIGALDRFIQLHPAHRDIAYAYYLRALSQYEQINDSERDQRQTEIAMAALQDVVSRFPDTAYARDARLKIDLARDHLAGREMHIARFYQRQGLYTAAIGRYRRVVEEFQTTNHVPEALHRLTEIYLTLGLRDEARRTAAVLGHNYPGNEWYQDTYALVGDGVSPSGERPGLLRRAVGWIF